MSLHNLKEAKNPELGSIQKIEAGETFGFKRIAIRRVWIKFEVYWPKFHDYGCGKQTWLKVPEIRIQGWENS